MQKIMPIYILALICVFLSGCNSNEDLSSVNHKDFIPEKITDGYQQWNRETESINDHLFLLEEYLKLNSSVTENPLLRGNPQLYKNKLNQLRFYWFEKLEDQINWMFIEFQDSKFLKMDEGITPQNLFQ